MIRGQPKFDGIAVGEIAVSFMGATLTVEAKAAFADSRTGETHGWTKNTQWPPDVIAKLRELRALMELHLGAIHFQNGGEALVAPAAAAPIMGGHGGLGEHLGGEGVPSV